MIMNFQANRTYEYGFIGDSELKCTITILKVTAKTVVFKSRGEEPQRAKIHTWEGKQYIYPTGKYSMCPSCYAEDEVKPVEEIQPEVKEEKPVCTKECAKCSKPVENNRKKFCSDSCKYWFNVIKKDNEKYLAPAKKRNENFFYMLTGSEVCKSSSRQGKRVGHMIMGAMSARIPVTTEEVVPVTKENLQKHFKGITGYIPMYIRLGDQERVSKQDIYSKCGIKL